MKKKQRIAVLVAIALAVPGVGNWDRQAADAMTADTAQSFVADITKLANQAELYHKVYKENTAGHISYSLQDDTGNTLSRYTSSAAAKNKRSMALPVSYDPRGTEQETPIRNQQDTGACWAFGALKALESDCLMKGILTKDTADLSENHLAWYAYHALDDTTSPLYGDHMSRDYVSDRASYNKGGNADVAQAVLANKWGAVAESEAPFDTASNMASVMKNAASSLRTQSLIQLTDSECYDPYLASDITSRNEIKEAILTHGAMDVALYYNPSNRYYKETNGVYASYAYMVGPDQANHCVTIVGWDDDFNDFTTPILFCLNKDYAVTLSRDSLGRLWQPFIDQARSRTDRPVELLVDMIDAISRQYQRRVAAINRQMRAATDNIHTLRVKDIATLAEYERKLNDYLDALIPMNWAVEKLLATSGLRLRADDKEDVEDLSIDLEQVIARCKSLLRTITNVRDSYRAVMDTRLNETIRLLTVITVALTIPTMIAGLFGMNVPVPGDNDPLMFWKITVVSIVAACALGGFFLRKR